MKDYIILVGTYNDLHTARNISTNAATAYMCTQITFLSWHANGLVSLHKNAAVNVLNKDLLSYLFC